MAISKTPFQSFRLNLANLLDCVTLVSQGVNTRQAIASDLGMGVKKVEGIFELASLVDDKGSALLFTAPMLTTMSNLRNWAFAAAFAGIGYELSLEGVTKIGKPVLVTYLVVTLVNTVLALGVAKVIFG